jgi:hypothetical protein
MLEFPELARVTMQQKVKNFRLECFWALWKVQNKASPTVPPEGQTKEWKALKRSATAASEPQWVKRRQESICE